MPRITAPTVAEHRTNRRAAILAAAEALALEGGAEAVTVAAVAARAGMARPSVYDYFGSVDALLGALVEDAFERWRGTLAAAGLTDGDLPHGDPDAVVRGWFDALATSAAAGNHRLAGAFDRNRVPDDVRARIGAGHRETSAPLARAAADLGAPVDRALPLLQAVAAACIARVEAGGDPAAAARTAATFALGGLHALAPHTPAP